MPRKLYAMLALAGTASAVAASTVAAAPPALRAKRAQAQAVLAQVNALDLRFGHVVDAWDGARIQLATSTRRLAANRRALQRARRQSRIADRRLAQRLVAIYEGGEPTLTQVVVGASSVLDLIDGLEAAKEIAAYDRRDRRRGAALEGTARRGEAAPAGGRADEARHRRRARRRATTDRRDARPPPPAARLDPVRDRRHQGPRGGTAAALAAAARARSPARRRSSLDRLRPRRSRARRSRARASSAGGRDAAAGRFG